ncbi:MAG: ATP-dependent DNA helicase RecG [Rhizobiales bacterium]|nr:ATP-dependent DNA helicase RecG [Hyphomicrobiales bacterium]
MPRIGPKTARLLGVLLNRAPESGEARIIDILWHWPYRLIDRRARPKIAEATEGEIASFEIQVLRHEPSATRRRPYKVMVEDDSGELVLVFFHASAAFLKRQLPQGEKRIVSGRLETYSGTRQIVHPDYILTLEEFADMPQVEPIYSLTAGLTNRVVAGAIRAALPRLPEPPEWHDKHLVERQGWPSFAEALKAVHTPLEDSDLDPNTPARQRLAFDELTASQLALAILRRQRQRQKGRSIAASGDYAAAARSALPFVLTPAQNAAVDEVLTDMASPEQMLRLVQGDVGSGKTLVAAMAMLTACESGAQAALMAPTEVLARQHLHTLTPIFAAAGVKIALLTGREKGATRRALLEDLASGEIGALIGTHALFQDDVVFHDLALAVIDEQQRFGVHQRLALQAKSGANAADLLVMTATPIPRTLVLTHYGNMDVTSISERPPGRGRIETRAVALERTDDVVDRLEAALAKGARVYWICPQIDEDGEERGAAAIARHQVLASRLGSGVALAHGRQSKDERDQAMSSFRDGDACVLVATTVVEVGVDVPEATIMVIEQAERFGLSQLHQLRGRIGRGGQDGACVLLYSTPLGAVAARRLDIMRETDDGFRIAEEDLTLRGGGEILGTRQSGLPDLRAADPIAHGGLIEMARNSAELILARDPAFGGQESAPATMLLYVFERDDALRLLAAG